MAFKKIIHGAVTVPDALPFNKVISGFVCTSWFSFLQAEKNITEEIQRIIRSYYKSLYAKKLENVKEMDLFLPKCHISKLNQDQVNNLNRPISHEEITAVIKKNLPT